MTYDFKQIEPKWREFWEKNRVNDTPKNPKKKFYILEMFPYPSGDIHAGHFRNYSIGDVVARYKMLQGFDVLHPFGWDAFGMPAEQAAIKHKINPKDWTMNNISVSRNTLQQMGLTYDWEREFATCNPDYYKWTQWLFLKLWERGLVYKSESNVNFCETCNTVLADEQAAGGICWRCDNQVVKKKLDNCWFFKYSSYAQRLLDDLDKLTEWPEYIKTMQRNWIGRSEGAMIDFELEETGERFQIFTTRPDTVFGVTFMSFAPEHPYIKKMTDPEVKAYVDKSLKKSEMERQAIGEKDGVFTKKYAKNLVSGERVPIWVSDYVVMTYGTGAVMAVPAHDQRDYEFAKKFNLPIKLVINPKNGQAPSDKAYEDKGVMVNSGQFNGLDSGQGIKAVIKYLIEKKIGSAKVQYRLRDWLISRQRYWGCPIPVIHCAKCGTVPMTFEMLPSKLPEGVMDFNPKGRSPLSDCQEYMEVRCPQCGREANRDPDTMDTFIDSSFYMIRFADARNPNELCSKDEASKWLPIDLYIGGTEHACGHLMYFRFITKVLYDSGLLPIDEPAIRLFNQGMVHDKDGQVMSKSRGNAILASTIINEYGIDISRIASFFFAPSHEDIRWDTNGIKGSKRFLERVWQLINTLHEITKGVDPTPIDHDTLSENIKSTRRKFHQIVKKATHSNETDLCFNTTIARMMEFLNLVDEVKPFSPQNENEKRALREITENFVLVLSPFAPFIAEELWQIIGKKNSIFTEAKWPCYDEKIAAVDEITIVVQVNGKLRAKFSVKPGTPDEKLKEMAIEQIKQQLDGKTISKVIVVPNKLVNIVV